MTAQPGGGVTGFQESVIDELVASDPTMPSGTPGAWAHGAPVVVTVTGTLVTETLPALSCARTAYWYVVDEATLLSV